MSLLKLPPWVVVCLGCLAWTSGALAQAPAVSRAEAPDLTISAARLLPGEHIKLDGTLSHPAWQRASVFNRFVEKFPATGTAPSQETRVQVLFGEHAHVFASLVFFKGHHVA